MRGWRPPGPGTAVNAERLWAGLERPGPASCTPPSTLRLPTLTTVRIPEGVDGKAFCLHLLNKHGIEVGGGLGALAGQVWRIGLMGYNSRAENVDLLLNLLETELPSLPRHRCPARRCRRVITRPCVAAASTVRALRLLNRRQAPDPAAVPEPFPQLAAGRSAGHPGHHLHVVVSTGVAGQIQATTQGPTLGIAGAEHHPTHPGLDRRPRTHAAGLQGHHQRAAVQPPVAEQARRLGQGRDLGVAQGILVAVAAVAAPAHAAPLAIEHHSGDRNLTALADPLGPAQQATPSTAAGWRMSGLVGLLSMPFL
jgi:hypothetical protein